MGVELGGRPPPSENAGSSTRKPPKGAPMTIKTELLQPAATITAALLHHHPAPLQPAWIQTTFVDVFRQLLVAEQQLQQDQQPRAPRTP